MQSSLTVTSYKPSFSAITTIKDATKLLSEADIKLLKSMGQKIGNNTTDIINLSFKPLDKNPKAAYVATHYYKFARSGHSFVEGPANTTIPVQKISPFEYGKRLLSKLASHLS